jgi:hypothetical protein
MAKNKELAGFAEKRKILFGAKSSPEKMRQTGELFMDAERYDDALEFFQRCEAQDHTREIARRAMTAGNTPLYMRAKKVLGEEITEQEWSELAATAEKAGLYSTAYVAHLKAGHEEEAARLRGPAGDAETREEPAEPSEGAEAPEG